MPLTPKAKHAREMAGRVIGQGPLIISSGSQWFSLAEEYIRLFDDYEDRYRRAKVEALEELAEVLRGESADIDYGWDQHESGRASGLDRGIDLIEERLRYLKEGGE